MAKLTREEVIARVKERKSLANENLSGLDLSHADLSRADLSRANLGGADFQRAVLHEANLAVANLTEARLVEASLFNACLIEANLRGCDLHSANLEEANLSGADLTGANIYNIATTDWKIEGVKCEYVYNSLVRMPSSFDGDDFEYRAGLISSCENQMKKTRRDFAPGEFEQIYKSFPKLELIFKEGFSNLDHRVLLAIIDRSNVELPTANLKVRKMEKVGDTTIVTLSAETKEDTEKIADMLQEQYAKMRAEIATIKGLLTHQNPQSPLPLPVEFIQLPEIIRKLLDRLDKFKLPEEVIVNN